MERTIFNCKKIRDCIIENISSSNKREHRTEVCLKYCNKNFLNYLKVKLMKDAFYHESKNWL